MKTIKRVMPVADNRGDAGLPREMFDDDGSLGVDSVRASRMVETACQSRNVFFPTKVKLFRRELGR